MILTKVETGHSYRLRRDFEVRNQNGTLKAVLAGGTEVHVLRVEPAEDAVYVEGCDLPIPLEPLEMHVDPVE